MFVSVRGFMQQVIHWGHHIEQQGHVLCRLTNAMPSLAQSAAAAWLKQCAHQSVALYLT